MQIITFYEKKGKNLKNLIELVFKSIKDEIIDFINFFNNTWIKCFDNNTLQLNEISIKFRTNNCLDRYNSILKKILYIIKKENIDKNLYFYEDIFEEICNYEFEEKFEYKEPDNLNKNEENNDIYDEYLIKILIILNGNPNKEESINNINLKNSEKKICKTLITRD